MEACIEEGDTAEALKYIVKLTDPQERAEVCMHHFFDECKLKIGKYVAINAFDPRKFYASIYMLGLKCDTCLVKTWHYYFFKYPFSANVMVASENTSMVWD